MNPQVKDIWLAALRSGHFAKGENKLHNAQDNTYCCLGVLCVLADEAGIEMEYNVDGDGDGCWDGECSVLPDKVVQWADLTDDTPELDARLLTAQERNELKIVLDEEDEGDDVADLTSINDSLGHKDFTRIADLIEAGL